MNISLSMYAVFKNDWNKGVYAGQRFGQAFYNHFNLHRLVNQDLVNKLYYAPTESEAKELIFDFIDPSN